MRHRPAAHRRPVLVLAFALAFVVMGASQAREIKLPAPEAPDACTADVAGNGLPLAASARPTPSQPRSARAPAAAQTPVRVPAPLRDDGGASTPVPRFHRFLPGMMH